MPLPNWVEFILANTTPTGQRLASPYGAQFYAVIPAGQTSHSSFSPPAGSYAAILYHLAVDCIPGILVLSLQHSGQPVYVGVIDSVITSQGIPTYLVVTSSVPVRVDVVNRAASMDQSVLFNAYAITLPNSESLQLVEGRIRREFSGVVR